MSGNASGIGIFDSGAGGLTVARQIMRRLPNERIVYFGDSKRAPYGDKPIDVLKQYCTEITAFLTSKDIKVLVIGCGTVSANFYEDVCEMVNVPVFEMILPAVAACDSVKRVGVIATAAAINSGAHSRALANAYPDIDVFTKVCPLFVPLVEEGWIDDEISDLAAKKYLESFARHNLDGLILGCTHYPMLANSITKAMGDGVKLIDPAAQLAQSLANYLQTNELDNQSTVAPRHEFYVSANPHRFQDIAMLAMGEEIDVGIVDISNRCVH